MANIIRVQLVKSGIGQPQGHKDTLRAMGLTKLNKTVTLKDSPSVRGMINKVCRLVKVVED